MHCVYNNVAHWVMESNKLMLEFMLGTIVQNAVRAHIVIRAVQTFEPDAAYGRVANVTMCWVQWVPLHAAATLLDLLRETAPSNSRGT